MTATVGQRAPDLRAASLDTRQGEPVVLAFVDSVSLPRPADAHLQRAVAAGGDAAVAALRAELRGLGAALVLVSTEAAWRFRPDDDFEPASPHDAASVDELRVRYAAKPGELSLFVIDGSGILRFARSIAASGEGAMSTLVLALGSAGRALTAARRDVRAAPALPPTVSRRELVVTSLLGAFALVLAEACGTKREAPPSGASVTSAAVTSAPYDADVTLDVNGAPRKIRIDPRVSLLDALRERLSLPGTKKGCDHGQCGACTVLVDGRRVNACLTLAIMVQGMKVTTIEGLATGETLHPVQAAFVSEDGFQCGYCTPGQIMSAVALLTEGHATTDDEVREQMSGNICRCGAYPNIVSAIQLARKQVKS